MLLAKVWVVSQALAAMSLLIGAHGLVNKFEGDMRLASLNKRACINKHMAKGHPREVIDTSNGNCLINWGDKKDTPWGLVKNK